MMLKKLLTFAAALLLLAASCFATNYVASTTGSGSTCSAATPCTLQTGLNLSMTGADTLCLKAGTYTGKFLSPLTGGTVKSCTGEWAVIDGYETTTLTSSITNVSTTLVVGNANLLVTAASDEFVIDGEVFKFCTVSNATTLTGCSRAASGTVGSAASHTAGATVVHGGTQLYVSGSSTTYRDFEVRSSSPYRNLAVSPENTTGNGIFNIGNLNKFVNLYVHDNLNGIFSSNASSNTEIYGVISFDNGGYKSTPEGLGHGYYLENSSGYSRVWNSMALNNYNMGMQGYGVTGAYVGGNIDGSIYANNGAPVGVVGTVRNYDLLYGTDSVRSSAGTVTNSHFFHPHSINSSVFVMGYGAGVTAATVTNNYFVGGANLLNMADVTTATVTGNKLYTTFSGAQYTIAQNAGYTWNTNTYYKSSGLSVFGITSDSDYTFATWKARTGYDASSTETGAAMPDTAVLIPNTYETGRATLVIYAPSNPTTISVDLSTSGLANGQGYTIRNAFDYRGAVVASGNYSSGAPSISVPLTTAAATAVATSLGTGYTAATTAPQFFAMVVAPTTSANSTGMGGVMKYKGGVKLR